jgi:RHS repeat-associated protein
VRRGYSYGFNGKENDSDGEWGRGLIQDYGFRLYNPAICRFNSIDPLRMKYPELTVYQFASNTPIWGIDLDGLEVFYATDGTLIGNIEGSTQVRVVDSKENIENVKIYCDWVKDASEHGKKYKDYNTSQAVSMSKDAGMTHEELNTRAFLTLVRHAEAGNIGKPLNYDVNYGGETFSDFTKHPNKAVTKWGNTSTAAGAYQILYKTWKTYKSLIGVSDFTQATQDKMAVEIINQQEKYNPKASGVVNDVQSGNVEAASNKLNRTWTSLPNGEQEHVNTQEANVIFKDAIKSELSGNSVIATPKGELLTK